MNRARSLQTEVNGRQVSLPKGFFMFLGFLGTNAFSSIGFKTPRATESLQNHRVVVES
jgi:hypothetical protein